MKIADIGCGTGASTLVLAKELDASVTAVDFLPDFIHDLDNAAERENLGERIETRVASMEALPFEAQSFDAIWSEGAIYNMGFANGIKAWRRFLKPDGILAVSELTWLAQERPTELQQHWMQEYPEVDTASAKMAILEEIGGPDDLSMPKTRGFDTKAAIDPFPGGLPTRERVDSLPSLYDDRDFAASGSRRHGYSGT